MCKILMSIECSPAAPAFTIDFRHAWMFLCSVLSVWLDVWVLMSVSKFYFIFPFKFLYFLIFYMIGRTNSVDMQMLPKGEWPKW